jgi:hypothetical protein
MDWQILINIAAGGLVGIGGWFARQLWDAVKELKRDISKLELHISEKYVKKSDLDFFKNDMDKRFDKIELMINKLMDKLDSKADK